MSFQYSPETFLFDTETQIITINQKISNLENQKSELLKQKVKIPNPIIVNSTRVFNHQYLKKVANESAINKAARINNTIQNQITPIDQEIESLKTQKANLEKDKSFLTKEIEVRKIKQDERDKIALQAIEQSVRPAQTASTTQQAIPQTIPAAIPQSESTRTTSESVINETIPVIKKPSVLPKAILAGLVLTLISA